MKHILHVVFDDETGAIEASPVPRSSIIALGMLEYVRQIFATNFTEYKNTLRSGTPAPCPDSDGSTEVQP